MALTTKFDDTINRLMETDPLAANEMSELACELIHVQSVLLSILEEADDLDNGGMVSVAAGVTRARILKLLDLKETVN